MSVHIARPEGWPSNVRIIFTTREKGVSDAPYASFNLAMHVGDAQDRVRRNREKLLEALASGSRIAWLSQVHGTRIVAAADSLAQPREADGCWTQDTGIACAVMSADCLPVLITDATGTAIAAVHAGWRGLAAGVIEAAVAVLPCDPGALRVWLGPAIGSAAFEVGPEVREAFLATGGGDAVAACFKDSGGAKEHYLADLRSLAILRLRALGINEVQGVNDCTFENEERYFSHRREGSTGRMACLIVRY